MKIPSGYGEISGLRYLEGQGRPEALPFRARFRRRRDHMDRLDEPDAAIQGERGASVAPGPRAQLAVGLRQRERDDESAFEGLALVEELDAEASACRGRRGTGLRDELEREPYDPI